MNVQETKRIVGYLCYSGCITINGKNKLPNWYGGITHLLQIKRKKNHKGQCSLSEINEAPPSICFCSHYGLWSQHILEIHVWAAFSLVPTCWTLPEGRLSSLGFKPGLRRPQSPLQGVLDSTGEQVLRWTNPLDWERPSCPALQGGHAVPGRMRALTSLYRSTFCKSNIIKSVNGK